MEAHVDVGSRADCSLISSQCTMPGVPLTFLLLETFLVISVLSTDSSQVSSTSNVADLPTVG